MELKKINEFTWQIDKQGQMKVPAIIYASEKLLEKIKQDNTLEQSKNVACLKGIQKASYTMPDAHNGYGFPIGGVAAMDAEEGVISPGGIGFDINCGVNSIRTNLTFKEVQEKLKELIPALYNDVPVGAEGEILIKGPNVFNGYWNKPSYNKQCFRDGWFITGDVGKIDEKNYVYIIGRSKDVIISGGINIYPREIEDVVESLLQVKECAVVGVPDKEFGESVKAYVVLNSGSKLTEDDVINYCREKLASFKKPKFVEFLDALPKNTMGKIIKEELRKRHKSK